MIQKHPRIVIVGAGFGGLQAAQSLAKSGAEVLLIDRNNYHTFVPLLYQVAAAQIEPAQIAYPIRTILRQFPKPRSSASKPLGRFLMAEVKQVNFDAKVVETEELTIPYDFLVLATGSQSQFFDVPGAQQYALPLRTIEEAVTLRNHILHCFEQASLELDPIRQQQWMTFVIVGGGATGVELAGALMELIRSPLPRDYPSLNLNWVRIVLVQSGDRLLPDLPPKLGRYTQQRLAQIGVEVHLQTRVERVTHAAIYLQTGDIIHAATTIWATGLEAVYPNFSESIATQQKGKLLVRPTLQLQENPEVYAIGDLAYVESNGKALTGVAPEALQQGVTVARNIRRQLQGKEPQPFRYFNKGRLAIIGCYSGVGDIGGIKLTGFLPWFLWLSVHLVYLPGFRSRLLVLLSWLHNYLLHDRSIRLIFPLQQKVFAGTTSGESGVRS
ncbi:NAD(P)/FAD-dependent oxidoreductase [Kovacikia minuta CCNUW1]|uniref:NAD(P)/FAD-dependent oxidoreductase n=1 Tax=Kovacikia minuta TaxID=2931930 RepID=UPI001CCEACE3|nr:NAD(P)/FAD-dependent oxidoreductase [Kovacikia minuta]UBF28339.1 NAD(P)/FAD-dependent oxidoreductase [Kovacikia minuta CCNUW1]